ncbi:MAG: DUF502 domain-containing protein [Fusobacteriaceae bacterium]|nr:DUF502 domain-containing protein [Fusobacteriaceae bacterium]MBN2837303.1 DUF502 domain-containing protein [Fusobacteriaceae bacterium]
MKNNSIRKHFVTGLLSSLPIFLTFYLLFFVYKFIAGVISSIMPLNTMTQILISFNSSLESKENIVMFIVFLLSLIFMFFVVYFSGVYINKGTSKYLKSILDKIPLIKTVYSLFQQIIEVFFSETKPSYKKVVLVEYPRDGIYALGFVTNENNQYISSKVDNGKEKLINVFIPTTPNPTTGLFIMISIEKILETNYTYEEALKLIVSSGALEPKEERND